MKFNLDKLNPRNWQKTDYRCLSCGNEVKRRVYVPKDFELYIGVFPRRPCYACEGVMLPVLEIRLDEHNKKILSDRKAKRKEQRKNPTLLGGFPDTAGSGSGGYLVFSAKLVCHVPIAGYAVLNSMGHNWLGYWGGEYYSIRELNWILDSPELTDDWRAYLQHTVTGRR